MTDKVIITCSCPSNTGKLAEEATESFNMRHPGDVTVTMDFTDLRKLKFIDVKDAKIIAVQGCENNCPLKKLEKEGLNPVAIIRTTDFGFERKGTHDPSFADIEKISCEILKCVRGL